MRELVILDRETSKKVDLFHLMLLIKDEFSLLPEIYDIFGDSAVKFIDLFSGCTVRVPSSEDLKDALRDVDIYLELNKTKNESETASALASRYNIEIAEVRIIFRRVAELVKKKYRLVNPDG